jgi:hypothetical protein
LAVIVCRRKLTIFGCAAPPAVFTDGRTEVVMIEIHTAPDAAMAPALRACRVHRVDSCNAVCMVHNPACSWATPYGNYCEHSAVDGIAEYNPWVDAEVLMPFGR